MTFKTTIHDLSSDAISIITAYSHVADLVRWLCSGDRQLTTLLRQSMDQLCISHTCLHEPLKTNLLPPVLRACHHLRRLELFTPESLPPLATGDDAVDLFTGIQQLTRLQTLKLNFEYDGLDLAPERCTFSFPPSLFTLNVACVGLPLCAIVLLPSTIIHLTCSVMIDTSEADTSIVSVFPAHLRTLNMGTNAISLIRYIPVTIEELAIRLLLPGAHI
jgi:hypothetical protein